MTFRSRPRRMVRAGEVYPHRKGSRRLLTAAIAAVVASAAAWVGVELYQSRSLPLAALEVRGLSALS